MLKRQFRLPAGAPLPQATVVRTSGITIKLAKNNFPYSRFGFVVSKRVDKRATVRNRIKRLLRSCIEEKLSAITGGYDALFIVQTNIAKRSSDPLCAIIATILQKQGLLS